MLGNACSPLPTSADPEPSHPPAVDLRGRLALEAGTKQRAKSRTSARALECDHDRLLVEAAREGDERAFGKLVERYRSRAFAVAVRIVRDEHDAEDLVQEAFLRVYRSLDRFHGQCAFFTWLYRIVKNLALDALRKPGLSSLDEDAARRWSLDAEEAEAFVSRIDGAEPLDFVWRRQMAAHLRGALDALPSYHSGVMLMAAVEELSYQEMADAMNVSRGTIMSRLFHARRKLRLALDDYR